MTSHGRAVRFAVVLMLNAIAVPAKAQVFYGPPHIPARQLSALEPGFDPDMPGATPKEQQAALVWSLRQALLLGALQCHAQYPALLNTANYNALLTNHGDELTSAFRTLTGYFKRTTKGMKPAQDALDRFVTRMTTSYSTVKGQPTFCHTAGWVGQRALSTPKGQLGTLANEHLAELRESLKGGNDQALRGVSFGSMVVSRRIPSLEKRCWSKKGLYNARKCG